MAEYRIEIVIHGTKYGEISISNLDNDERWEDVVTFSADRPGDNQKVEFLLYRGN